MVSTVPGDMKKTVLDAWNGYHSFPLAPSARDATTFITKWGRYRYLSDPMGFHTAEDAYTRYFDDITNEKTDKIRCVDEFTFAKNEVEFDGFLVTSTGVKPTAKIVYAISKFPTPQNITGMRSWFGLINQVAEEKQQILLG